MVRLIRSCQFLCKTTITRIKAGFVIENDLSILNPIFKNSKYKINGITVKNDLDMGKLSSLKAMSWSQQDNPIG